MKRHIISAALFVLISHALFAQNDRIAVMGSSTAAGTGVPVDSAWRSRIKKHYQDLNIIDTLYNLAQSGADCYMGMPTGYVPPAGRPLPNPNINITRALSFVPKPTVVIVNFPSNGYDTYSYEEILFCLQTIKNTANAEGVDCYITSSQPRDDFSPAARERLKIVRDSIVNRFGDRAIDFHPFITDPNTLGILALYALGDAIHLNSAGHALLAQKVLEKDIFGLQAPLPVRFESFSASKSGRGIQLNWKASAETRHSYYTIEKSTDGQRFTDLTRIPILPNGALVNSYQHTDVQPVTGANYYRVRHTETNGDYAYSRTVKLIWNEVELSLGPVYPNPLGQEALSFTIEANRDYLAEISIEDLQGRPLYREKIQVSKGTQVYSRPLNLTTSGPLLLRLHTPEAIHTRLFIKRNK